METIEPGRGRHRLTPWGTGSRAATNPCRRIRAPNRHDAAAKTARPGTAGHLSAWPIGRPDPGRRATRHRRHRRGPGDRRDAPGGRRRGRHQAPHLRSLGLRRPDRAPAPGRPAGHGRVCPADGRPGQPW